MRTEREGSIDSGIEIPKDEVAMDNKISVALAALVLSSLALGCSDSGSDFDENATGGAGGTSGAGGTGATDGGTAECWDPRVDTCTPSSGNTVCHEFYANDNSRNHINYVNEFDPSKNWQTKIEGCLSGIDGHCPRQVAVVASSHSPCGKALLVSFPNGYREYDVKTGELLHEYREAFPPGVTGAVRLPNGNTALGNGNDTLVVVNPEGQQVSTCELPGAGDLRILVREEDTGWFWFGRMLDLYAVNDQCQEQWHAQLLGGEKAYKVFPCGDFVYATTGATALVHKYDRATQQVVTTANVGGKAEHADLGLDFFSGFHRFDGCNGSDSATTPEGNIIAASWLGHVETPAQDTPHLIEFTADNQVAWTWGNQDVARQVTNVWVVR
jgi:hypothetical protein